MRKFSLKHLKTILAMPAMCLGISANAQLLWTVGQDDNGWPAGDGGGANASFLQENGTINPLPGSPVTNPAEGPRDADNDYYFAGVFTTVLSGNGAYAPVGVVAVNEEGAERAFAAADNDLRYHFNLPGNLNQFDLMSVTFDPMNLHEGADVPDSRYGVEVYFNGVKVQSEILIRPAQLNTSYTTAQFSLASVGAQTGPGFDNIVSLRGVNYNADGGGNWMGVDYVKLNATAGVPPLTVGLNFAADDNESGGVADAAVAGVVPQAHWNNLNANNGSASALVGSDNGAAVTTTIGVTWSSPNTWSSTGRGEENNQFPAGPDRTLMTGYLDTDNAAGVVNIAVTGIPPEFTSGGYDVIVYALGGTSNNRFGAYSIGGETKILNSAANPTGYVEDLGVSKTDNGNYTVFKGQFGTSFNLIASAVTPADGNGTRAPVSAIQIVKSSNPEAGLVRGYLTKKRYNDIGGTALSALLTNPKYLDNTPDSTCLRSDFSANDSDECDNCGFSVQGYFIPTATGPHTFYISADDGAGLFLSTDENPANKVQIASEPEWNGRRNFVGLDRRDAAAPQNISAPVNLIAGKKYYIEGAVKEGGGGDNFDAAVQGPGDAPVDNNSRSISGNRIATRADLTGSSLAITANPAPITRTPEGDAATFTVAAAGVSPLCGGSTKYQWQRNGVNIADANSSTYSFGPVRVEDHLSTYACVVSIPGLSRTSTSGTLEVLGRECLRVVGAVGSGDLIHVNVAFSTFIDQAATSTTEAFNYAITGPGGPLAVSLVELGGDGKSVVLTTDAQAENTEYVVTVTEVQSVVGSTTCASPDNQAGFRSWLTGPAGGVELALWNNIGGTALIGMTSLATYPNSPDEVKRLATFDTGPDFRDNYGGRVRGLFIPPVSGAWNLYVTADDASKLFFNATGPSAAGAVLVNEETGCCTALSGRRAGPFNLVAGQGYYMEGIYKEGGGGDYIRVAARLASDTTTVLAPMPPSWTGYPAAPAGIGGVLGIAQQPANSSVLQNSTATFTVGFSNPNGLPVLIQWYRDGVIIDGATKASYSLPLVSLTDNGAKFTVTGAIIGSPTLTSAEATLTVSSDIIPPTCVAANGSANFSTIVVTFSELLEKISAETTFSYTISPLVDVASATLLADGKSVLLTVTPALTPDTDYTVTTEGVADLAGVVQAGSCSKTFHSYKLSSGFLNFAIFYNMGGTAVSALTGDSRYPNSPDERRYLTSFNTGPDFAENYGGNITGFFIPPTSGDWNFYLRSDDASELWFDKNDGAGLVKVQEETGCCGTFSGHATAAITLVAGEKYPIQVLYKEGGGGDYAQVAARLTSDQISVLVPISGAFLAGYADPSGVSLAITQQPADQSYLIIAPTAGGAAPILDQNFATDGGFTASGAPAAFTGAFAHDAAAGSWQVNAVDTEIGVPYTSLLSSPAIAVGRAGYVYLNFSHRWSVEGDNWDGCRVEVSVNGGAFTALAGSAFSAGGYNGAVRTGSRSILTGQEAFVGDSANHQGPGYVNSAASLGYFNAGDNVVLRFVYAGDTNSKGTFTPSWEVTSVKLTDGNAPATVTFATAATAVVPGNANPPKTYQWYRNGSAIVGANSASYTFTPVLADNGNKYSCNIYTLGAQAVTREATLTVAQPNTPPTFACGPNVVAIEDGGAQSLAWATAIKNHSIARVATAYANDFSAGAAGMTLAGVLPGATVADGVLKLTVPNNSAYGAASIAAPLQKYESLDVSWKSYVGGGAGGGADGYSLNIGTDVPADPGYGGEEGIGNGLIVTVDTFDNGTGEDVGVDIKWAGARVAYVNFPKDDDGTGRFIRKSAFVNAHLTVDAAGLATMTYDGDTISGTIPGYAGIQASRALFWARTGGANDNMWVDDFAFQGFPYDLSSSESSQTVQFNVSNDNASLFSVQPAIGADGTLTYTPAANANGVATVNVVAQDSGGTANGGRDTSASCSFTITIGAENDCPVAGANQSLTTLCQTAVSVALSGSDIDGDALTYVISGPAHGTLSGTAPNVSYMPAAGFGGQDSFSYVVYDGQCRSGAATVTITVGTCSTPPTAVIGTEALVDFAPDFENPVLISCNWWNACLVLDGWTSSASNGGALTYLWFDELEPVPFDSGVVTTNCYEVGTHTITLIVEDSNGLTGTDSKTIEVLTAPLAIELLIEKVNQSHVTRSIKRELVASLRVALNKAKDEKIRQTQTAFDAFEKKVRAKITATYPEQSRVWIKWSQAVSTGMEKCIKPPRKAKDHWNGKKDDTKGNGQEPN